MVAAAFCSEYTQKRKITNAVNAATAVNQLVAAFLTLLYSS